MSDFSELEESMPNVDEAPYKKREKKKKKKKKKKKLFRALHGWGEPQGLPLHYF